MRNGTGCVTLTCMEPWILYALVSAAFAALVAVFGKIGLVSTSGVDSTLATAVRAVIMAGFLVTAALALGKGKLITTLDSKALLWIALSGVAGAISWLFYFVALKHGPATGVSALDRLSVVFVVIFAIVFLGEAFTWQKAAGAVLITAGALLMVLKWPFWPFT